MDDDLGWNDFELRSYDPQIGRFLQNDPYDQFASGYVGMGNDPVNSIDEDGGLSSSLIDVASKVSEGIDNVKTLGEVIFRSSKAVKKAATVWSVTKSFFGGVASALTETAKGLVSIVTDPIGTLTGLAHAVTNPIETWNGIKEAANETWNVIKSGDPDKIAGLAGNLVGNLIGGGVTGKALSAVGKLAKGSKFVKTVRKIAKKIPCGCFLAGTLVFTDTGQKAIENIQVGDKVWAYNDTTGDYALKKVVSLFSYVRDSVYNIRIGEETIQATADHPFFISGHWLRVAELKVGDSVKTYDGSNLAIEQITVAPGRTTVYNFEVEDYHTYYVSKKKVLVHNSGDCPTRLRNMKKYGAAKDLKGAPGVYEHFFKNAQNKIKSYTGQADDLGGKRPKESLRERERMAAAEGYEYTESRLTPLEGSGYDNLNALEGVKLETNKGPRGDTYNKNNAPNPK